MRFPRRLTPYGPDALLLDWEARIAPDINDGVHAFARALRHWPGVTRCIPAYASLLVRVAPPLTVAALRRRLLNFAPDVELVSAGRLHEIPVCYGGTHGPDLPRVAHHRDMDAEEVIRLHAGREYRVYLMGFRPGFGFLGELDARLAVPRKQAARTRVPGGSVGLADGQTGIYPTQSPGGWQLIGRTPWPMVDTTTGAARLAAGDRVRFVRIDEEQYLATTKNPPPWPSKR